MNSDTIQQLQQAGWTPDRRVDDDQLFFWLKTAVQEYNCHIFPEAVRVLQEYGGLILPPNNIHISPMESGLKGDPELWLLWEWQVSEVLFPIAYQEPLHFHYALSSTGKVYGAGVVDIFCGNSFEEFLENVYSSKRKYLDNSAINRRWTDEMDAELTRLYQAVFEYNDHEKT